MSFKHKRPNSKTKNSMYLLKNFRFTLLLVAFCIYKLHVQTTCNLKRFVMSISHHLWQARQWHKWTLAVRLLQWAFKKGKSTELLLTHLTESWRYAVESKRVVGVVFVDFMKAFDMVSHNILLQKLENTGIGGDFLLWLKDYLANRKQFVSIDGQILRGSVLGRVLFSTFIDDLPAAVQSAETFLYADDTTLYCIAESVDVATTRLNRALAELRVWCNNNNLIPHPGKCRAMLMYQGNLI